MDTLKSIALSAATIGTIFTFRSSLTRYPDSPLNLYILGGFSTLFCLYVLPLRYNIGSPWLSEWSRRRVKRANAAKRRGECKNGSNDCGIEGFEQHDLYGLEHSFLNMDLQPRTMWANVGYWENANGSFPRACQAAFDEMLKLGGVLDDGPISVLEVGCGCVETALHLLNSNPKSLANYLGINLNKSQAQFCDDRLRDWESKHGGAESISSPSPRVLRTFQANGALPATWPKELCETIDPIMRPSASTPKSTSRKWLLALDVLYHFTQRETAIRFAREHYGTSLMATDLIIEENLPMRRRWGLWISFIGLHLNWSNRLTRREYVDMLVRCGYQRENIHLVNVSKHVFLPYATFLENLEERWHDVGGSLAYAYPFTLFRYVLRYWAWAGTINQYIVIAHAE